MVILSCLLLFTSSHVFCGLVFCGDVKSGEPVLLGYDASDQFVSF